MKTFMHATPEGFKCDPQEISDGLPITVDLLKSLGGEQVEGAWQFRMHGYVFRFEPQAEGFWNYIGPGYEHGHSATHLDECFGFLAEDMFQAGRREKLKEVRDALGIGGEVGEPANIITPEPDPS